MVLCAMVPDACGPLSSVVKLLDLQRAGALTDSGTSRTTAVEPVDRTLAGLLPAEGDR